MISDLPGGSFQLNRHRAPPTGTVGKDANGKVIPHERSEEVALLVAQWVGGGATEQFMCAMLNIRPGLLRKHYYNELTHGAELANQTVASKAFQMATSGESEQMTKFWLEKRAGWKGGDAETPNLFNIHIHSSGEDAP